MSWARSAFATATWAGDVPPAAPVGQQLPPSIPRGTKRFTFQVVPPTSAWGTAGWGGITPPTPYTGGGIIVAPDPVNGVSQVVTWWPFATALQVVRVAGDGTISAVRGGNPISVMSATRTNYATNPSVSVGLNGYVPGAGNPTLTQVARTDAVAAPDNLAWQATIATAGTCEVTVPHALPVSQRATVGVDLRVSARPTAVTITVGYNDSGGNALTASVATLTSDQVNASISQYARQVVTVTAPPGAASVGSIKIAATGLPANGSLSGDRLVIEQYVSDGSYVDGDTLGGQWLATPELSTAVVAPIVTIVDGEAPLDVPVIYYVYNQALYGGSAASDPVVLSGNNTSWLTHPARPSKPVSVRPTVVPSLVRTLTQGVFPILGSAFPVVVTDNTRQRPTGTLVFDCNGWAERDALLSMLSDGAPLLLRTPDSYGYGRGRWLAFGDATEDAGGRAASVGSRTLSAPFIQVAAPSATNLLTAA